MESGHEQSFGMYNLIGLFLIAQVVIKHSLEGSVRQMGEQTNRRADGRTDGRIRVYKCNNSYLSPNQEGVINWRRSHETSFSQPRITHFGNTTNSNTAYGRPTDTTYIHTQGAYLSKVFLVPPPHHCLAWIWKWAFVLLHFDNRKMHIQVASFGQQLKILKWQGPLRPCGRMEEAHRVHCFGHTHIYGAKKSQMHLSN